MEEEQTEDGVLLAWDVPEFEKHERSHRWYVIASLVAIALLVFALATANFTFAILIVMGALVLFLSSQREPERVPFAILPTGIAIGDHFHAFHEFRNFALLYDPPVKRLYLSSSKRVRPTIMISLEDTDPVVVRETLLQFLPEDLSRTEESMTELIARLYKL